MSESNLVEKWLATVEPSSRKTYDSYFKRFVEFTGMTPEQILEDRRQDSRKDIKERKWENKLVEFRGWLKKQPKKRGKGTYSDNASRTAANAVRSFFSYYGLTLHLRRGQKARVNESMNSHRDYRLTLDDIRTLSEVANPKERYVLLAGKSFGLRATDFIRLTRGQLEPLLNREPPIPLGVIYTKKEKAKARPFIDRDALPAIKAWLKILDAKGKTEPETPMLSIKKKELTWILQNLFKKAGINTGDYQIRFHILRKFLTDRLAKYMSDSKWKQIVGKKVSEDAYVSEADLRELYAKTMKETCVYSLAPETNELELLKARISELEEFTKKTLSLMATELKQRYDIDLTEFMKQISA